MAVIAKVKSIIRKVDRFSPYPLFYPFIMSKQEKVVFDDVISRSSHYLEFGLGGSSLRAIQRSKAKIYTVESSAEWVAQMNKYLLIRYMEHKRIFIHVVNIGPTTDWGYPKSDNDKQLFQAYSSRIFESINIKLIDLVFIDGRFRVACILKTILSCYQNDGLKILIHDFWNREYYHIVLKYLQVVKQVDTIGLFTIKNNIDLKSVQKDYERYKFNPE